MKKPLLEHAVFLPFVVHVYHELFSQAHLDFSVNKKIESMMILYFLTLKIDKHTVLCEYKLSILIEMAIKDSSSAPNMDHHGGLNGNGICNSRADK